VDGYGSHEQLSIYFRGKAVRRKPYGAIMEDVMRIIRSDDTPRLKRIDELMDAKAGTPEGAELDRLVDEQVCSENQSKGVE
jgi:hypothetical protein